MKVLITGGAGYVGNELTFQLLKDVSVEKIIIYDNLSRKNYNLFLDTKYPPGRVEFIYGELLDTRKLKSIINTVDVVYHLAARVSTPFANEDTHLFEQINHWGTAELVYALEESRVSRLIYLSTTSVYGASDQIVDINTIPNPKSIYGSSKLRGEEHIKRLFDKIPSYVLRCGNIYGYSPSLRFEAVINKFMFDANFTGRIQINGNGNQHRSFIHIDKVVNVLQNILTKDFPSGIYNLVDKYLPVIAVAEVINEIYPNLEMIFVNQHLSLREMKVVRDERIRPLFTVPKSEIKDELIAFKNRFAFTSVR